MLESRLAKGGGDGAILAWIEAHQRNKRTPWEIQQWSDFQDRRGPDSDAETLALFVKYVTSLSTTREDIKTWADMLDVDDHVTFGGQA